MRRFVCLSIVTLAVFTACSSDPETSSTPTDAGGDTRVACGVPGEAVECLCIEGRQGLGRCLANGTIDPCVCLPLHAEDAGADSAPIDSAPGDTGTATDTSETGVDARETVEHALCAAGAPRLSWKGVEGCYDKGTTELTEAFHCRFRTARDGMVRCLPRDSTTLGGYASSDCTNQELTTWTIDPVPPYLMLDDTPVTVIGSVKLGSGAWYRKESSSCVAQTTTYPHFTSKDETVRVTAKLADTLFVAAPF